MIFWSASRSSSGVCRRPAADSASSASTISTVAGHAHVGGDQQLLEPLPHALVVGVEGELVEALRERAAGAPEVLAQAREEAAAAALRLGRALGRGRDAQQHLSPGAHRALPTGH